MVRWSWRVRGWPQRLHPQYRRTIGFAGAACPAGLLSLLEAGFFSGTSLFFSSAGAAGSCFLALRSFIHVGWPDPTRLSSHDPCKRSCSACRRACSSFCRRSIASCFHFGTAIFPYAQLRQPVRITSFDVTNMDIVSTLFRHEVHPDLLSVVRADVAGASVWLCFHQLLKALGVAQFMERRKLSMAFSHRLQPVHPTSSP